MVYPNENMEPYNDRKMKRFVRRAPTEVDSENEIGLNEEEQVYRVERAAAKPLQKRIVTVEKMREPK